MRSPFNTTQVAEIMVASVIGFYAVRHAFDPIEHGILDLFNQIPFILLIVVVVILLSLDIIRYKTRKGLLVFAGSAVAIIAGLIVTGRVIHRNHIDKLPTLLTVKHLPEAGNVFTFKFKKNGYFQLEEMHLFGTITYHGRYSRENDTVKIISSNHDALPATGFIRSDTMYWQNFDTMKVDNNLPVQ